MTFLQRNLKLKCSIELNQFNQKGIENKDRVYVSNLSYL